MSYGRLVRHNGERENDKTKLLQAVYDILLDWVWGSCHSVKFLLHEFLLFRYIASTAITPF